MLAMAPRATHMTDVDDTDGGRPRGARSRLCVVTRQVLPIDRLLRFVAGPDGEVVPDLRNSLPGRGVWVSASAAAVVEAVKRQAFPRALKRAVRVPADLAERVDALLLDRAREALSIANKAGEAVSGFAKVEAAIANQAAALLHAREAARDGVEKLDRTFVAAAGPKAPIFQVFSGAQLDLALGRSNVIHAALGRGPAAKACLDRIRTLVRFREGGIGAANIEEGSEGRGASSAGTDRE